MRCQLVLAVLLALLFNCTSAQQPDLPENGPGFYFNNFQKYSDNNTDSALFYLDKLASKKEYLPILEELIHDSFAQSFQKRSEEEMKDSAIRVQYKNAKEKAYIILAQMLKHQNINLVKESRPIFLWTQVLESENNEGRLQKLLSEFTETQLSSKDLYTHRVGRYALLIHQTVEKHTALRKEANALWISVTKKLKDGQVKINPDSASRSLLEKRAWYRYLYAYTQFARGSSLLKQNKIKEAEDYLKNCV